MINLRNVRDVRYATKPFELSSAGRSAVVDHGKGQKHNDALKKVLNFFKKPLSVKETTVEGVDVVEFESDNQVPTSNR